MWVHFIKDMKKRTGIVIDTKVVNGISTHVIAADGGLIDVAVSKVCPIYTYMREVGE